jgi:hypothetical protein
MGCNGEDEERKVYKQEAPGDDPALPPLGIGTSVL